jgi:polyhydroxybutyrate depolymerase
MSFNPQLRWFSALVPIALVGACTVAAPDPGQTTGTPMAGTGTVASGGGSVLPSGGTATSAAGTSATTTPTAGTASGGTGVGGSGAVLGGTSAGGGTVTPAGGTAAGGASVGGGGPVGGPTAGCGKTVAEEPGKDVLHNIMVKGVARRYWTKLPSNYDGSKPTPLVFYGPGCGAGGVEGAPLDNSIKDAAMRVFVIGTGGCFDTDGPEPETGYFNAVLDELQANYCTDTAKVFVSGYSSGAWLSDLLSCTAGDRIRAIGTAAGGFHADHPPCKGNPSAMFHAGTNDGANPITKLNGMGVNEGSSAARDRLLMANGCTMETKVWDPMYPYCKEYIGCKTPVVWCQQDGVGHSNGEEVARTGWWKFWSSLP